MYTIPTSPLCCSRACRPVEARHHSRLQNAMRVDHELRVFVGAGRYDSLNMCEGNLQMAGKLEPDLAHRFTNHCYEGGHMMYRSADAAAPLAGRGGVCESGSVRAAPALAGGALRRPAQHRQQAIQILLAVEYRDGDPEVVGSDVIRIFSSFNRGPNLARASGNMQATSGLVDSTGVSSSYPRGSSDFRRRVRVCACA